MFNVTYLTYKYCTSTYIHMIGGTVVITLITFMIVTGYCTLIINNWVKR